MRDHATLLHAIGLDAVALATGTSRSAVKHWRERNCIPGRHWLVVAELAGRCELDVTVQAIAEAAPPRRQRAPTETTPGSDATDPADSADACAAGSPAACGSRV
jgi:hypothetical protein